MSDSTDEHAHIQSKRCAHSLRSAPAIGLRLALATRRFEFLEPLIPNSLVDGLEKIAFALVAILLFFSPLVLGGAPLWATCVAGLLSFLALVCVVASGAINGYSTGHHRGHRTRISLGVLPFGLAALAMSLQLIPLPIQVVKFASPQTFQTLSDALTPLGMMPSSASLSLDPSATSRALLTTLTCLTAFVAASQLTLRHRHFGRQLAQCIALSGLTVAIFGFLHALGSTDKLLGIWAFSQAHPPFLTTFGNPNHLASFLAMAGIVASMLALTEDIPVKRLSWWLAYVLIAVAIFLSLSRAGLAAFLVGQALFATCHGKFLSNDHHRERSPKFSLALVALVLGLALVAGLYVASENFLREWAPLTQTSGIQTSKVSLAAKSTVLAKTFWQFGVGKDAFEPALQKFLTSPGEGLQTLSHPENIAVDWLVGLGIPLGTLVILAFCWSFIRGVRTAGTHSLRWCALAAVFAAITDDFFNFALSFIGAAIPFSVLFALGTAHRKRGVWTVPSLPALAGILALSFVLSVAAIHSKNTLKADGDYLVAQAQTATSRAQFESSFRQAVARHPVDYFPRLTAAEFHLAHGDAPQALALSGQAMALFPALSAPHRVAAQALQALDAPAQAFSEWMIVWNLGAHRDRQRAESAIAGLIEQGKISAAQLEGMAINDRIKAVSLAKKLLTSDAVASANTLIRALHSTRPATTDGTPAPEDPEVLFLQHAVARRHSDREEDLSTAIQYDAATGMQTSEGALLVAQALSRANRRDEAIDLLKARLEQTNAPVMRLNLAQMLLAQGRANEAKTTLKAMPTTLDKHQRDSAMLLEAAIHRQLGEGVQRLQVLRSLSALHPASPEANLHLAEALAESGMDSEALLEAQRVIRAIEDKAFIDQAATSSPKLTSIPPNGGVSGGTHNLSPKNSDVLKRAKTLEARLKANLNARKDEAMKRQFGLSSNDNSLGK